MTKEEFQELKRISLAKEKEYMNHVLQTMDNENPRWTKKYWHRTFDKTLYPKITTRYGRFGLCYN